MPCTLLVLLSVHMWLAVLEWTTKIRLRSLTQTPKQFPTFPWLLCPQRLWGDVLRRNTRAKLWLWGLVLVPIDGPRLKWWKNWLGRPILWATPPTSTAWQNGPGNAGTFRITRWRLSGRPWRWIWPNAGVE